MRILIVYGSTEGQTRKICHFALQYFSKNGHAVALCPADTAADLDPAEFDGVLLAASVHTGHYQSSLVEFAKSHASVLKGMKSLFLSVSLAAAGDEAEDWAGLSRIVDGFAAEIGWTPNRIEQIAGAFRFSDYDFFKYWAMRWIESQKDPSTTPGEDREYTDWDALENILGEWAA